MKNTRLHGLCFGHVPPKPFTNYPSTKAEWLVSLPRVTWMTEDPKGPLHGAQDNGRPLKSCKCTLQPGSLLKLHLESSPSPAVTLATLDAPSPMETNLPTHMPSHPMKRVSTQTHPPAHILQTQAAKSTQAESFTLGLAPSYH